jgi:hypothetical protein
LNFGNRRKGNEVRLLARTTDVQPLAQPDVQQPASPSIGRRLARTFGLPPTTEVWIRVVGMLAALLGVYYWTAAATELTPFFRASVLCRLTVPLFFLIFVAAGWARWPLILFGVIDALGAAWTWRALGRYASAA